MNKLGDISVNEDFFQSVIQFSTKGGATKTFVLPGDGGEVEGRFTYFPADGMYDRMDPVNGDGQVIYGYSFPDNLAPGGWYLYDDNGVAYCMNDVEVPYGSGFMVDGLDEEGDPIVMFSGTVSTEDAEIPLEKLNFTWTGNCMPVNYTLGDITVNDDFFQSVIQFSAPGGATKTFVLPGDGGEVEGRFTYFPAEGMYDRMDPVNGDGQVIYGYSFPDNLAPGGWYLYDDNGVAYCMNSVPVLAGDGFCVDGIDEEGTPLVIIPSPLAKKED